VGGHWTPFSDEALLPEDQWVFSHWIPFDEKSLMRALGLHGRDLEAYLYNDHHTLADLARSRGIDPERLADRLLLPLLRKSDVAQFARLRDHTLRILTQGHLAQHVFFHIFHGVSVRTAAPDIFRMSGDEYWRLRQRGYTPGQIARRAGVSSRAVRAGMIRLFRGDRDAGVKFGLAWESESDRIFRRQVGALSCWMHRPGPPDDHANPYGKARIYHGAHARDWPATVAQRRVAEQRVERFRRSLPRSCWTRPAAWSSQNRGLGR